MSELILHSASEERPNVSPFDRIRRVDERGEYWLGRELAGLMTYSWQNFGLVIARALDGLREKLGTRADVHIVPLSDSAKRGVTGNSAGDYRLSRLGCYFVAQCGDGRKQSVIEARLYFAVMTHVGEMAIAEPARYEDLDEVGRLERYLETLKANRELTAERDEAWGEATALREINQRNKPKVDYVDHFVQPREDFALLRTVAKEMGVLEKDLRDYLVRHKRIFRAGEGRLGPWQPYAAWGEGGAGWFALRDRNEAEYRGRNGEVPVTMFVTPVGKAGIKRMDRRDPILRHHKRST